MRITCYYDHSCDMGYIYLRPPAVEKKDTETENELFKYLKPDQINIPYTTDQQLASHLDQMVVAPNTFKADYENGYDTEYGNDMDEKGYITGIELILYHDRFIDLVKNQAIKVIRTEWRDREFHVITFDHADNVFNSENVIYKLTDEEDAFVIVQLEEPEKLGYTYTNIDDRHPIALFKALISARDDIYPLEYLLKPQFLLRKDEGYLLIEKGLWCSSPDKELWDSISIDTRVNFLNSFICEKCSAALDSLDCSIDMKSKNSLISNLYCNQCEHRFVKEVAWD